MKISEVEKKQGYPRAGRTTYFQENEELFGREISPPIFLVTLSGQGGLGGAAEREAMKYAVLFAVALLGFAVPVSAEESAGAVLAPAGTSIQARFDQEITSKTAQSGEKFTLTEREGLFHHAPAALKGAKISGHVENVVPASHSRKASMNVIIDEITLADGTTEGLSAKVTSLRAFEPKTHHIRDAGLILGGAVAGHLAAGRHHGGLAGAAGGFALATSLKSNIDVKRGTLIDLKLTAPLTAHAPNS